ncbi:MAG: ATP-binding protein [Dehalococcoidales bacterium]|nr:ATP-binding protein [Dehalococcoidales bacterium]
MEKFKQKSDADILYSSLVNLPEEVKNPALLIVSGLPGTGKTHFSKELSKRLPFVTLESDVLRCILNPNPNHSKTENARLFSAIHSICERLLREGHFVIVDATNLTEKHRQHFYDISDRTGVKLIIVQVNAAPSVVKERLENRVKEADNQSDADWQVYKRMKKSVDKIRRKHYSVDTTADYRSILDEIVEEIKS